MQEREKVCPRIFKPFNKYLYVVRLIINVINYITAGQTDTKIKIVIKFHILLIIALEYCFACKLNQ